MKFDLKRPHDVSSQWYHSIKKIKAHLVTLKCTQVSNLFTVAEKKEKFKQVLKVCQSISVPYWNEFNAMAANGRLIVLFEGPAPYGTQSRWTYKILDSNKDTVPQVQKGHFNFHVRNVLLQYRYSIFCVPWKETYTEFCSRSLFMILDLNRWASCHKPVVVQLFALSYMVNSRKEVKSRDNRELELAHFL